MPVEMIGWIAPRVSSELIPPSGPPFDANVVAETARIHERAGFDRVLIGYFSDAPDGFLVGAHAAAVTERLGFLLAHRPGFVAPPVAAVIRCSPPVGSRGPLPAELPLIKLPIPNGLTRCASAQAKAGRTDPLALKYSRPMSGNRRYRSGFRLPDAT